MICPECTSKLAVETTKNIPCVYGLTFRYRICPVCGLVVETSEEISRVIKKGFLPEFQKNVKQKRGVQDVTNYAKKGS